MSDRRKENPPLEMNTNWHFGVGNYEAQRQLDYKLVGGILRRVSDDAVDSENSDSENRKDN
jgi:hypothetical protein